jgi:hypothetical protein
MTSTAPWRRMILHFSHIGFTDGLTFMIPFGSSLRPAAAAAAWQSFRVVHTRSQGELLAREQEVR